MNLKQVRFREAVKLRDSRVEYGFSMGDARTKETLDIRLEAGSVVIRHTRGDHAGQAVFVPLGNVLYYYPDESAADGFEMGRNEKAVIGEPLADALKRVKSKK